MSIRILQLKDHSISVYQAVYATSIVANYTDTSTVKTSKNVYKTTLPSYMIFSKNDVSTSDEQGDKLDREFNIHYRDFIGSLFYLSSEIADLIFAVHKLEKFSSNHGKVYLEGYVHLLIYIRDNTSLCLKYYADIKDALLSDLLRQANIKTDNQLVVFSDSSCQDCPATVRSTGVYIIFYQGGPIDRGTHFQGPVAQSSAESE